MKKYEFTGETIEYKGKTLHRIVALRDFGFVKAGDLGGYVESESNLSHEGNCWIANDAIVSGSAEVGGSAIVKLLAKVSGYAKIFGDAIVSDLAEVFDHATIFCNSKVYGSAKIGGFSGICGSAEVYEDAEVGEEASAVGRAKIHGSARVHGSAIVCDAEVCGSAEVCDAEVCDAEVCGDAKVNCFSDYIEIKNCWSSGRYFTYTRSNGKYKVGCFYGTGEELIKRAYEEDDLKGKCYGATVKYIEEIYKNIENAKNVK